MGNWDKNQLLYLNWSEGNKWEGELDLDEDNLEDFEFKFVLCQNKNIIFWEPGENNNVYFSALINENILCMHGGLSKDLQNIDQINKILRPTDIPDEGLLCDLLWSDPNESLTEDFGINERNISTFMISSY